MSSISWFDIISVVLSEAECEEWWPDPKIFLYILASAADADAFR